MSTELCPICNSTAAADAALSGPDRLHRAPGTFSIYVCSSCGSGRTLPHVSAEERSSYYPAAYGYALEQGLLGSVQKVIQKALFAYALARPPLRALAGMAPGTVLDVGCGRGDLGEALVRRGWRVAGVEPSREACAFARRRGIEASVGTLETVSLERDSFDAVVMRHSLEHVPDPIADLTLIQRALRPGGLLFVSVPNFACWERKRFGSAWFHLDLPRHRTHFVPRALQLALARTGFEPLSVETSGDLSSLLSTLQYRFCGRLLWTGTPAFWTMSALGLALSPVTALANLLQGGGPVLHAVARRPLAGAN